MAYCSIVDDILETIVHRWRFIKTTKCLSDCYGKWDTLLLNLIAIVCINWAKFRFREDLKK